MKRSRSAQCGALGSNFMKRVNSTVAMSAAPIGNPGWPELAFSTASMDRKRMAFAIRSCFSLLLMVAHGLGNGVGGDAAKGCGHIAGGVVLSNKSSQPR